RPHRCAVDGAHLELVAREAVIGAVQPEGLTEHPELEGCDAFQRDDGDAMQHAPTLPRNWQKIDAVWHFCHCPPCRWRRSLCYGTGAHRGPQPDRTSSATTEHRVIGRAIERRVMAMVGFLIVGFLLLLAVLSAMGWVADSHEPSRWLDRKSTRLNS